MHRNKRQRLFNKRVNHGLVIAYAARNDSIEVVVVADVHAIQVIAVCVVEELLNAGNGFLARGTQTRCAPRHGTDACNCCTCNNKWSCLFHRYTILRLFSPFFNFLTTPTAHSVFAAARGSKRERGCNHDRKRACSRKRQSLSTRLVLTATTRDDKNKCLARNNQHDNNTSQNKTRYISRRN